MKKMFLISIFLVLALSFPVFAQQGQGGFIGAGAQSQSQSGAISGAEGVSVVQSPLPYLQSQPIYPYLLQMVPGVVGDVTDRPEMPNFYQVKPLMKTDEVVKVVYYTRGGRIAGFSRLEDFDTDLINLIPTAMSELGQNDTSKIRFKVLFKMSVKSIGMGGGAGGGLAGATNANIPNLWGANASVLPAVAVNTSDPRFILKFYLIK